MNFGLRAKLVSGFALALVLCSAAGVGGVLVITNLIDTTDALYHDHLEPIHDVGEALLLLERMNTSLEEAINADDPLEQANDVKKVGERTRQLDALIARVKTAELPSGGRGQSCWPRSRVRSPPSRRTATRSSRWHARGEARKPTRSTTRRGSTRRSRRWRRWLRITARRRRRRRSRPRPPASAPGSWLWGCWRWRSSSAPPSRCSSPAR